MINYFDMGALKRICIQFHLRGGRLFFFLKRREPAEKVAAQLLLKWWDWYRVSIYVKLRSNNSLVKTRSTGTLQWLAKHPRWPMTGVTLSPVLVFDTGLKVNPLMGHLLNLGCLAGQWSVPVARNGWAALPPEFIRDWSLAYEWSICIPVWPKYLHSSSLSKQNFSCRSFKISNHSNFE